MLDGWEHVAAASAKKQVLLLQFPRPQDAEKAFQLGIDAILAQPLLLADVAGILAGLLPSRSASRETAA